MSQKNNKNENINENITNEENNGSCSEDLSEDTIKSKELLKPKKISLGSSILHILPIKLKDKNECQRKPVDELFEKYIKKNETEKSDNYDCTLFRGRWLNGKNINIENNDNFNINYLLLNKDESKSKEGYKVMLNKKVSQYYVWKYDSLIEKDNNLMSLENNLKKLDILS